MCGVTFQHSFGLDPDIVLRSWKKQCSSEALMLSYNIQQDTNGPRHSLSKLPLGNWTAQDYHSILSNFVAMPSEGNHVNRCVSKTKQHTKKP